MQKVKTSIKTALASLLLAGAFTATAAAGTTNNTNTVTEDSNNTTDNSKTYNLEECSGIINNETYQDQEINAENNQVNNSESEGLVNHSNDAEQNNDGGATASGSQSSSVNFNPDCSEVTNVTKNVTKQEAQVSKTPSGGVNSGAGGAAEATSASSIVGLVGSIAALGLGAVLRFRGVEL